MENVSQMSLLEVAIYLMEQKKDTAIHSCAYKRSFRNKGTR